MGTLRIAWRNLGRNPRRTAVVLGAVLVGIAGTVLAMAINNALLLQMVDTAIQTELGHVQVHAAGYRLHPGLERHFDDGGREVEAVLVAWPGFARASRRLRTEGLVYSPRASVGVRIVGVDAREEAEVSVVADAIVEGVWLGGDRNRAVIGAALARRLQVEVGDKLVVSAQDLRGELTAEPFRVGGLFRTASSGFDETTVFLHLADAQVLLGAVGGVSEVVVVTDRRSEVAPLREALRAGLGDRAEVESWDEIQPLLVMMIDMMDQMGWAIYGAVFVAMAFGIANVLLMSVYERMREIGILLAIGLRPRRLLVLIVAESVLLTSVGLVLGFAVALAAVAALGDGLDLSLFAEGLEAYGVGTTLKPVVRAEDFAIPTVVAFGTAILASLWPAVHALRLRPADALRRV